MKKGYVNWKLVLVLLIGLAAVAATVVGVRQFNRTHRAQEGKVKGLEAFEQRQWKQAAVYLGQYLVIHPNDAEILYKYGIAQSRILPQRKTTIASAINALRNALRNDPTHRQAVLDLANLYMQTQQPAEAELTAQRFLEHQKDPAVACALAAAQIALKKYDSAAQLLQSTLREHPDVIDIYVRFSQLAEEKPDLAGKTALDWLSAAIAANPQNPQGYLHRARYYLRTGKKTLAVEDLQSAQQRISQEDILRIELAGIWYEAGEFGAADKLLENASQTWPREFDVWMLKALIAYRAQDPQRAAQTADQAVAQLAPDELAFLPFAVELWLMGGQTEKAQAAVERLRKEEFEPGVVFFLEGLVARQRNDLTAAMAAWREALTQGYMQEPLYLNIARGAMELGDRATAIETLRRFLSRNPRSAEASALLADILAQAQNWREATAVAAAGLQWQPEHAGLQQIYSRCRIALSASDPRARRHSNDQLEKLLADSGQLDDYLLAIRIAIEHKDWKNAQARLKAASQRHGQQMSLDIAHAQMLAAQGKRLEAVQQIQQTVDRYPLASDPVIYYAMLLAEDKQFSQAEQALLAAAVKLDAQQKKRCQLALADIYARSGQTDKAIGLLEQTAVEFSQDILVRRQLLNLSRAVRPTESLQRWVDEIKAIEGPHGRLWRIEQVQLWLADKSFENRYAQAMTLMNENLKQNPDDKHSLVLLAMCHQQTGRQQLAVSAFRDALSRHPDDADLAAATLSAMYQAQMYRQADQLLAELTASGHSDPRFAQMELQSHIQQGRLDSAERMLQKMAADSPDDVNAKLSLAVLKTRSGDFEAAGQILSQLKDQLPESAAVRAALVDWHMKQNQPQQALAECEEFVSLRDSAAARRLRAQVFLATGKTDAALADLDWMYASAVKEKDIDMLLAASRLYQQARQNEKSVQAAQKALNLSPDDFDVQKHAALLFLEQTPAPPKAIELLEKALKQQPRDGLLRVKKAQMLLEDGSMQAALEGLALLNAVAADFPNLQEAWTLLAQWYLYNQQPGMAMDSVLRGLASLPDNVPLLILKARIEAQRSSQVALATLEPLLKRYADSAALIEFYGQLLADSGKAEQASAILSDWLAWANQHQIDVGTVPLTLMEVLYRRTDTAAADNLFEQLQADEKFSLPAVLRRMGWLAGRQEWDAVVKVFNQWYARYGQGQGGMAALSAVQGLIQNPLPEALKTAEQIVAAAQDQEKNSPDFLFAQAIVFDLTGKKSQAIDTYRQLLAIQPNNVMAMNNLAWLLCEQKQDLDEAKKLAEKGLSISQNYADLLDTYGAVLYELGDFAAAVEQFRKALDRYRDTQPQKTATTYRLARALDKMDKKDAASIEYLKAYDLFQKIGGLSAEEADILKTKISELSK